MDERLKENYLRDILREDMNQIIKERKLENSIKFVNRLSSGALISASVLSMTRLDYMGNYISNLL